MKNLAFLTPIALALALAGCQGSVTPADSMSSVSSVDTMMLESSSSSSVDGMMIDADASMSADAMMATSSVSSL